MSSTACRLNQLLTAPQAQISVDQTRLKMTRAHKKNVEGLGVQRQASTKQIRNEQQSRRLRIVITESHEKRVIAGGVGNGASKADL